VFHRSNDQFWLMNPAQLDLLARAHRKAHEPPPQARSRHHRQGGPLGTVITGPPPGTELGGFDDLMAWKAAPIGR
jgi:hypothetical protein